MDSMLELISEALETAAHEAGSPLPGFFTAAFIFRQVANRYPGKGKNGQFTPQQMAQFKRLLNQYSVKKIHNRQIYFGKR